MEKQKIKKNKREMGKRQKAIEIQKKERIKARARDPDKHNQRERGNNRKKNFRREHKSANSPGSGFSGHGIAPRSPLIPVYTVIIYVLYNKPVGPSSR